MPHWYWFFLLAALLASGRLAVVMLAWHVFNRTGDPKSIRHVATLVRHPLAVLWRPDQGSRG